jgi:hypothetical protein
MFDGVEDSRKLTWLNIQKEASLILWKIAIYNRFYPTKTCTQHLNPYALRTSQGFPYATFTRGDD